MTVLCKVAFVVLTFFNLQFLFENKIVNFQLRQSHAHQVMNTKGSLYILPGYTSILPCISHPFLLWTD